MLQPQPMAGVCQLAPTHLGVPYLLAQVSGSEMSPVQPVGSAAEVFRSGWTTLSMAGRLIFYSR